MKEAENQALRTLAKLGEGRATSRHSELPQVLEQLDLDHLSAQDQDSLLQATAEVIRSRNGSNQNS